MLIESIACTRDEAIVSRKTPPTADYFNHPGGYTYPLSTRRSPPSTALTSPISPAIMDSNSASWPNLATFFNTAVFQRTPPASMEPVGKRHGGVSDRTETEDARHQRNRRTWSEATATLQDHGRRQSRNPLSRGVSGMSAVSFGPTQVITSQTPSATFSPQRSTKRKAINISVSRTESFG
jgi:hypothetical protein